MKKCCTLLGVDRTWRRCTFCFLFEHLNARGRDLNNKRKNPLYFTLPTKEYRVYKKLLDVGDVH